MNRIVDDPDSVAEDALAGIVAAHPDLLTPTTHPRVIRTTRPPEGRCQSGTATICRPSRGKPDG